MTPEQLAAAGDHADYDWARRQWPADPAERGMLRRVTADRECAFDRLAAEFITEPALVAECLWAGPNARPCGP